MIALNNQDSTTKKKSSLRKRLVSMGQLTNPDRVQRLFFSVCLMTLTIWGMIETPDWKHIVAITLQSELLLTALIGWCPIYCTCKVLVESDNPALG